jgi:hypothetical protein
MSRGKLQVMSGGELVMKIGYSDISLNAAEKIECREVVKEIVELARIAFKEGVFKFEERAGKNKNKLFKVMAKLIAGGYDPEVVADISSRIIDNSGCTGFKLFEILLIIEGLTMIQDSVHPNLIWLRLGALLDIDYFCDEFDNFLVESD